MTRIEENKTMAYLNQFITDRARYTHTGHHLLLAMYTVGLAVRNGHTQN